MTAPVIAALCTGISGIITAVGTAVALVVHARTPDAHQGSSEAE